VLLGIGISLYAITVVCDFAAQVGAWRVIEKGKLPRVCRWCPRGRKSCFQDRSVWRRIRVAILALWLFVGWALFGLWGIYYFSIEEVSDKNLTPAESRQLNQPCFIADFYDYHGGWHFLSAIFLLFQLLVTAHIGQGMKQSKIFEW